VASAGYWAITLIGRTVRWESTGSEHLDAIHNAGKRAIFTFWHGRIFPATWYWRDRGIVVMTSMNLDGEMIARCIQRVGYRAERGSSSRGGIRALGRMVQHLRNRRDVAFTIDGPRGPRYIAKQGPAILARKTGAAIFCFHIAMKKRIQLNSWDHFQIPLPFTSAMVFMAPPIWIPEAADEESVRQYHEQMQGVLDDLREQGNRWEQPV
jgi:lysophospholipid acyltransferase (LPLAT)-like uncharacterized protein